MLCCFTEKKNLALCRFSGHLSWYLTDIWISEKCWNNFDCCWNQTNRQRYFAEFYLASVWKCALCHCVYLCGAEMPLKTSEGNMPTLTPSILFFTSLFAAEKIKLYWECLEQWCSHGLWDVMVLYRQCCLKDLVLVTLIEMALWYQIHFGNCF